MNKQPHYHFPIKEANRTKYSICSTKQQQTTAFPCIIIINSIMCETLTVNGFNPHTQQIHQFEAKYNTEVRSHLTAEKKNE